MAFSLTFEKISDGYRVAGAEGEIAGELAIPSEYKGEPVREIGDGAFAGTDIAAVTIPASVIIIGESAFCGCESLKEVRGADGLRSIGESAFRRCVSLTRFTVPKDTMEIGWEAFDGCLRLVEVENLSRLRIRGDDIENGAIGWFALNVYTDAGGRGRFFDVPGGFTFYTWEGGDSLVDTFLTGYEGKERSVSLPEEPGGKKAYGINSLAFADCDFIESVRVPKAVRETRQAAFDGCDFIERVCVDSLDTWFGIFFDDPASNPLHCGADLYVGGEKVRDLVIPEGTESLGPTLFAGSALRSVSVPPSLRVVGNGAFAGCLDLEAVYVDDLSAWCSVVFRDGDANPLKYADALVVGGVRVCDLVIPDGVGEIAAHAFEGYGALLSLTLPESLKRIGEDAFCGCFKLKDVRNLSPLRLRGGEKENGYAARYAARIVRKADAAPIYESRGDFVFFWEDGVRYLIGYSGEDRNVSLPSGDENRYEIYEQAFRNRRTLESVEIPSGVPTVGKRAFFGCTHLKSVRIGADTAYLDDGAFGDCSALSEVDFGDGVLTIGEAAFAGCESLAELRLPASLESVCEDAFCECPRLKTVIMPRSVEYVGFGAFDTADAYGEHEDLTVYFLGTRSDWNSIVMGDDDMLMDEEDDEYDDYGDEDGYGEFDDEYDDEDDDEDDFEDFTGLEDAHARVLYYSEDKPTVDGDFWHRGKKGEPVEW